ncbi:MAG TPA: MFS transporter [Acidimicrobiales bacterium]|nr:MFS transporter [Acidimicrobiales bacterium]
MAPSDRDVDDPSGLVAKLRALGRDNNGERADFQTRVFGSTTFFKLWSAQAIASMGDWLGFLAILTLAGRIGIASGQPGTSIGVVMAARIIPGLFFSGPAGVLVDRMDRKQVMVVTTLLRAGVVATLPFVDSVLGLVFASFVLELAAMLFSPAKEATVPNLVPADRLTSANSLGLAAAYGTFPVASLMFALLAKVAEWLGSIDAIGGLKTSQEAVAFYAQVVAYLIAALIIARLAIPKDHVHHHDDDDVDLGAVFTDIKEGWHYAFINPVVRAVNLGLATGLVGGGMLIPLGQTFSKQILHAGPGGYGVFITMLGLGVGGGIIAVSTRQATINKEKAFVVSVFGAGIALLVGVSMTTLFFAAVLVAAMGVFAGSSYVLGFTLLQENVDDELRGRVFAGVYILVRMCVLLSMAIGPILVDPLNGLSELVFGDDHQISPGGFEINVPGVRLTLWLAGGIMLGASALAASSLRAAREDDVAGAGRGSSSSGSSSSGSSDESSPEPPAPPPTVVPEESDGHGLPGPTEPATTQ